VVKRVATLLAVALVVAACGPTQNSPRPASSTAAETAAAVVNSPSASVSRTPSASPTSIATTSPSVGPTPTPTPPPPPAWKTYRSKRNDYTIKYPPTWIVTPGNVKLPDTFDDFKDFVYVARDTVSTTVSLSLTQTAEIKFFKSHYKGKVLSSRSVTVAHWPGRLLTLNTIRNGRKLYIQDLILGKGRVAYFLVWWSDRGSESHDRSVFKSIYRTFKPT
jgi:hypothetical protein